MSTNACNGCGSSGTIPHTHDCLFGHFLDYQNWRELSWATKQLLRVAYEHGMREGAKSCTCVAEARRVDKMIDDGWSK
jgi:hypothetical protein